MKETNIKNSCCSRIIKYFSAAQKSLLLFCAAHWNKQIYFNAFALLWDDTTSTNCPGRAGFAKARYMKSFSLHKTAAIESVDLANCYDAVAHPIASIALQSFKVCKVMVACSKP
jgi:hypothetical protein